MTREDRTNQLQMSSSGGVTPDSLMAHFRGSSLKAIILFTVVLHILVLGGSSIPFLLETVFGPDTAAMNKEERLEHAMREATASLRDIAKDYDLRPQEISDQFGAGSDATGSKAETVTAKDAEKSETTEPEAEAADVDSEEPKSTMEKKLEVKEDGPDMPSVDDDIF